MCNNLSHTFHIILNIFFNVLSEVDIPVAPQEIGIFGDDHLTDSAEYLLLQQYIRYMPLLVNMFDLLQLAVETLQNKELYVQDFLQVLYYKVAK